MQTFPPLARVSEPEKVMGYWCLSLQGSELLSSYQAATLANVTESAQARHCSVDAVESIKSSVPLDLAGSPGDKNPQIA
jgi:hypothetical protein